MFYTFFLQGTSIETKSKYALLHTPTLLFSILTEKIWFVPIYLISFCLGKKFFLPKTHNKFIKNIDQNIENYENSKKYYESELIKTQKQYEEDKTNNAPNLKETEEKINKIKNMISIQKNKIDELNLTKKYFTWQFPLKIYSLSVFEAFKQGVVPQAVSEFAQETPGELSEEKITKLLGSIYENKGHYDEYLNYFRHLYLTNQLIKFSTVVFFEIANKVEYEKFQEMKSVVFNMFLGNILNTYKIHPAPINLIRFYFDPNILKKISIITSSYGKIFFKKLNFPHTVCLGEKEIMFYLLFAIKNIVPFSAINNIDFHNGVMNSFRQYALFSQKSSLISRLVCTTLVLEKKSFIVRFILIYVKFFSTLLKIDQNEICINLLDISGMQRDYLDLRKTVETMQYIDISEFSNQTDIVLFLSSNFSDAALIDRSGFHIVAKEMTFNEFVLFVRHQALEYMALHGNIVPETEQTELSMCLFLISKQIFHKIIHMSLSDQYHMLNTIFDFLHNNVNSLNFQEMLNALV